MIALIYFYYYHCYYYYYYYWSFIWLKAEVVSFVEISVDTTTDFVSGREAFVAGICNYEAHPNFASGIFSHSWHYQLFPLLNTAFFQSIFVLSLPSL